MRILAFVSKVALSLTLLFAAEFVHLSLSPLHAASASAQQGGIVVTGKVVDQASQPVIGAIVYSPEYNIAAMTDADGKYSITVPKSGIEIQVSFIGFKTEVFTVGATCQQLH